LRRSNFADVLNYLPVLGHGHNRNICLMGLLRLSQVYMSRVKRHSDNIDIQLNICGLNQIDLLKPLSMKLIGLHCARLLISQTTATLDLSYT